MTCFLVVVLPAAFAVAASEKRARVASPRADLAFLVSFSLIVVALPARSVLRALATVSSFLPRCSRFASRLESVRV